MSKMLKIKKISPFVLSLFVALLACFPVSAVEQEQANESTADMAYKMYEQQILTNNILLFFLGCVCAVFVCILLYRFFQKFL